MSDQSQQGAGNLPPKLKNLSKQLQQSIIRQQSLEAELNKLEHAIYSKETTYLQSTGNIIRGFDNYSGNSGSGHTHSSSIHSHSHNHQQQQQQPVHPVHDTSRVFSLSSTTYVEQLRNDKND